MCGVLVPEVEVRSLAPQPFAPTVFGDTAAMAGAVRIPIDPDAPLPTRRTLDERLYLRWPSLYASLSRRVLSLPPRSRLRRTLLRRTMLSGWAAFARWDIDLYATPLRAWV